MGMVYLPDFYPRSPCGERLIYAQNLCVCVIFLSTLSLRRATIGQLQCILGGKHFYPRSPCGERPSKIISSSFIAYFYPRSPCGERLYDTYAKVLRVNISIHALLAESDDYNKSMLLHLKYFYPRSPCGERHGRVNLLRFKRVISIHALLAESDYLATW